MTPPVKLSYSVGKERKGITAEDRVTAVLDTPVGRAFAKTIQTKFLRLQLRTIVVKFPGRFQTTSAEALGKGHPSRSERYQTDKDEVVVKAEFVDTVEREG